MKKSANPNTKVKADFLLAQTIPMIPAKISKIWKPYKITMDINAFDAAHLFNTAEKSPAPTKVHVNNNIKTPITISNIPAIRKCLLPFNILYSFFLNRGYYIQFFLFFQ